MIVREQNRSKSNPSAKPYETVLDTETGQASCTCRGWTVKKGRDRECTHTKALSAKHHVSVPTVHVAQEGTCVGPSVEPEGDVFVAARERSRIQREERQVRAQAVTIEPMLASAMTRGQRIESFMTPDWIMEEKYDGHRLELTVAGGEVVQAMSRGGNARDLPPQIRQAARYLPDCIVDGELVAPGGMSSDVTRVDRQSQLSYVVFDLLEAFGQRTTHLPYQERRQLLQVAVAHIGAAEPGCVAILMAASQPVSREAVEAIWARGGEGAILKRLAARYQPGYRSPDWIKVKKEIHVVVTVTGFATGDTGIPFGKTLVQDEAGRAFSVKTLDNATMRQVGAAPVAFVGRRLVLKCNEVLASGALRHPMFDHFAGEGE
jgi:hypothetical protein